MNVPLLVIAAAATKAALAATDEDAPVMVSAVFTVTAAEVLLSTKLLKLVDDEPPIDCAAVPLKVVVCVPEMNVPLLEKSPFTLSAWLLASRVPPELIVIVPATVSAF